ncbi:transmembrane protein, putative [Medicago truncatula]|uniref:Transmembrane protein, putative n=1 Tax=Medicago truncatula TaxID=3880 RepID=A0A072V0G7_MEDTR|nr:transmembrane protein, putative [Medicago truncatula]
MAPRKCKAEEMAATTSAMPGRVTRSLVKSSGEISKKVPKGSAVEGEKEEEENSRNVQEGFVVEGEKAEKNSKNIQEGSATEGETSEVPGGSAEYNENDALCVDVIIKITEDERIKEETYSISSFQLVVFNGIYFFFNPLIFCYLYHNIDTNIIVFLIRLVVFSSAEPCGTASKISLSAIPYLTFLELSSPLSHLQPQNLVKHSKRFHLQPHKFLECSSSTFSPSAKQSKPSPPKPSIQTHPKNVQEASVAEGEFFEKIQLLKVGKRKKKTLRTLKKVPWLKVKSLRRFQKVLRPKVRKRKKKTQEGSVAEGETFEKVLEGSAEYNEDENEDDAFV